MVKVRSFRGGAAVPHRKSTSSSPTVVMPVPAKVVIPLLQHLGAINEARVAKGDRVLVGQILGDSDKTLSAPVHSPVSGTVTAVDFMLWAGGVQVTSVEIATDGTQERLPGLSPPSAPDQASFLKAVRASGLVGLGGAGFPAHVKLNPPAGTRLDTLLINGAECEPYITSDEREILENSDRIREGLVLILTHLNLKRCLIGVEANKPEALAQLRRTCAGLDGVEVCSLPTRYPQGAEKMLIWALTGREVPAGKLPADVGVVVMNVASVGFLGSYFADGLPLMKKKVTVAGPLVRQPQNVEVLVGTPLADVFAFCGGLSEAPTKVIMGGPMMGVAQHSLDTCVVKQTNALLAFGPDEGVLPASTACLRCGRCVEACPMGLLPLELSRAALHNDPAALNRHSVNVCIECGCCAFVCPAKIQLVQAIRLGKTQVRAAAARAARS